MAKGDYEVTLDLPTGKSLTFVVPADQTSKYFDNNDPNKPKTDTLFKLAEQGFPKLFEEKRSLEKRTLESANRYYQGPGRVTLEGVIKPPTPSTTPRLPLPKSTAPAAAPSEAQIDAYRRRWFKEEASGSIPYQQMNKYLLSADRGNFAFPKGLSEVGKAAIRREVESRIQAQRAAEAGSAAKRAELERMAIADPFAVTDLGSPYELQAAGQGLIGEILPSVSRRFTAARTGQQASETLPLGLLPEQKLTPARGAIGTATRLAGELATPEAMALMLSGPALGGLMAEIPALGVAALGAGAIPSIQAARRGDYGAAAMNMLLNFGAPVLGYGAARGLPAARAAMASRMGRTAQQISDLGYTPVAAEPIPAVPVPVPQTQPIPRPAGFLPTQAQVTGMQPIPGVGQPLRSVADIAAEGLGVTARREAGVPIFGPPKRPSMPSDVTGATVTLSTAEQQSRLEALLARRDSYIRFDARVPDEINAEIKALQASLGQEQPSVIRQPEGVYIGAGRRRPDVEVNVSEKRPSSVGVVEPASAQVRRAELQGQLDALRAEKARIFSERGRVPQDMIQREAELVQALKDIPVLPLPKKKVTDDTIKEGGVPTHIDEISQTLDDISTSYKNKNPHSGGALTGDAKSFDALPDDSYVVVFHATTDANAQAILSAQRNYTPEMQSALNAGGSLSDQIYVASDPRVVSGMGETIVGFVVKKSDLKQSPEAIKAKQTLGQSVISVSTGAVIEGKPVASFYAGKQQKIGHSRETGSTALSKAYENAKINGGNPALVRFVENTYGSGNIKSTPIKTTGTIEPIVTASTSPPRTILPAQQTQAQAGAKPTATPEEGMSEQANQLLRAYQEEKAQQYGFEDQFPQRGSMTQDIKDAVTKVVEDPKERVRLLEEIKNTQGNNKALLELGVKHEVAAVMRQRELIPLINSDNPATAREAVKEYTYLSQVITKGGSKAGFALAMRRLFSYQVDLGQADAYENAVSLLVKTMKANGASDDSIQAAIARMKPRIESGTVLFKNVQGKINGAAAAVDAAVAQARAAGRRLTPEEITAAANKKLDALEEKYKPGWVGKSSPWVAPAVREYMNGARKLEQFRARMMDRYGDVIPEDKIDDLFRQAVAKFRNENAPVDEVMRDVSRSVGGEVWNSFSKGQRTLARLKNIQNYERLLVLGLDFGIFGVQFGLAQATRPFLGFGRLAQTEKRTGTEKVFGSVLGGIPSAKDVFSGEKAGGYIPGTIKAFANENAARNIESEIETLGRIRYSEFDNPFAEAGLMGFRKQDIEGGPLSGEFALDTQRVLDDMASWGKWGKMNAALYSRAQRATETGLRYGRALLFDQMMSPFDNLPAEEKLAAMKGVANFVNTLTGASTYGQKIENVVKMAGAVQTAPRYYLSNAEMVTGVVPLARTAMAAKGASAKTQALLAKAVAQEYGRIIVTGLAMKPIIESMGGEMITNPFDPDFGTARFSLTDGTEQTISLLSGREQYIQLAFSLMAKGERPAAGLPLELKSQPWIDKGGRLLSFAYGKSTLIPREIGSAVFPVNIPSPEKPWFEFRRPGGVTVSPSEFASGDIPRKISIAGQVLPAPLFFKQVAQNLPIVLGSGNTEDGRKIMRAAAMQSFLGGFGINTRTKMKPEYIKAFASPDFKALPPEEREKIRMEILGGK